MPVQLFVVGNTCCPTGPEWIILVELCLNGCCDCVVAGTCLWSRDRCHVTTAGTTRSSTGGSVLRSRSGSCRRTGCTSCTWTSVRVPRRFCELYARCGRRTGILHAQAQIPLHADAEHESRRRKPSRYVEMVHHGCDKTNPFVTLMEFSPWQDTEKATTSATENRRIL